MLVILLGSRKVIKERVFEFLAGLNSNLDDVRSRVFSQIPLSNFREVFAEMRREKNQLRISLIKTPCGAGNINIDSNSHKPLALTFARLKMKNGVCRD